MTSLGLYAHQPVIDGVVQEIDIKAAQLLFQWRLGGKHSTFAIKAAPGQKLDSAGEIFAFQHDPEAIGDNEYTVWNPGS